jgi:RNA polymerase sigma-70 factor, ECF subfamily
MQADPAWETLMAAAQDGDERAYATLLRAMLPLLRGIARRRLREQADAEDAVQETLLSIHRLRHTWDRARPLRPWVVAITERRCVDRLRAQGRRTRRETALDDVTDTLAAPRGADGESAVAARQLREAVADLPPSQREALRLAKLEDLPLAEASQRSGMSVGALKVATHRAIAALRKRLG